MKISIVSRDSSPVLKKLYTNFDVVKNGEICIVIGGDGAFMRAAGQYDVPILPIRDEVRGSIGYYSDLSINDVDFVVSNLKKGKYEIEKLENKIELQYNRKSYYAVNDVWISADGGEISADVYEIVGGRRMRIYPFVMTGDGLLITGKVGSTAYNRSAGGPILMTHNAMCLTFLNPDGPYRNPIVLDSRSELEIEVVKYGGTLRYDSSTVSKISEGDKVRIRMSGKELKIVRFRGRTEEFADKLERIIKGRMVK